MKKKKKIFIIAGEVSGDVLGAEIMRAVGQCARFVGIGGKCMEGFGLKSIFPISDLAVMGVVEVLAKVRTLTKRINQAADAIIEEKPDIVLTIDAPSFASRVIKKVKKSLKSQPLTLRPKFCHFVAPQVWAWGPGRAKKYAEIFDALFCFFDFEKPYFEKYGLKTIAVGHPVYDVVKRNLKPARPSLVALLPGSRMSEAERLMPIYKKVVDSMPNKKFAVPVTETTRRFVESEIKHWRNRPKIFSFKDRFKLYNAAEFAIVKSGTASAELAIMHIPAVVVYKVNWITEIIFRMVIKIKYASLVNILAGRTIYPELLGRFATADNIVKTINGWNARKMVSELKATDGLWHKSKSPADIVASFVTA